MFRRIVARRYCLMVLCVTASSAGCHGKEEPKPAASAPAAAAPTPAAPGAPATPPNTYPGKPPELPPAPPFEVSAPPGWKNVPPPGPLAAAWEGETGKNGFTPTLNVVYRPRPIGTDDEAYAMWKDELMGVLHKQYTDVKIMSERALDAGARHGKLIIVATTLPRPGGKAPMPLFTYGVLFTEPKVEWVLGAITSADLDVQTGDITPTGEPEILKALASFHTR